MKTKRKPSHERATLDISRAVSETPLFRRAPLITRGLSGKYYIPAEGKEPLSVEQLIIRMQNYNAELVDDLNAFYEASKTGTGWLTRCCYCDAIISPRAHEVIRLRLHGKEAYLWAIEDAYWDENFPPESTTDPKTLPNGMVLEDETLDSFHAKIRAYWMQDRENWTMEAEHMDKTPLRRVVKHLGFKPGATLKDQSPEWLAATPPHLYRT